MKVRLLSSLAGPDRGNVGHAGDEWECPPDEAERLIGRGMAEPIEEVETASVTPPENTMRKKARPRTAPRGSDEIEPPPGDSEPQEASETR